MFAYYTNTILMIRSNIAGLNWILILEKIDLKSDDDVKIREEDCLCEYCVSRRDFNKSLLKYFQWKLVVFLFLFFCSFLHQFNLIHLLYRYSFKVIIKRFISNINFYKVINQNENRVGLNTWLTQKSYNNPCYIVNILFWETTISSIVHTSCSIQAIV